MGQLGSEATEGWLVRRAFYLRPLLPALRDTPPPLLMPPLLMLPLLMLPILLDMPDELL